MIRLVIQASCLPDSAWQDDGFGGRELRALRKSAQPPPGYVPVPGTAHQGYRKREASGWVYWYPSDAHAQQDLHHHIDQLDHHGFPGMADSLREDPDPASLRYHHKDLAEARADADADDMAPYDKAKEALEHIGGILRRQPMQKGRPIKNTPGHRLDAVKHRWVGRQEALSAHVKGLSGDAFDRAVLDHAPRVSDQSAVGGGQVRFARTERPGKDEFVDHNIERIGHLVGDEATAHKVLAHARDMIVQKSGDKPEAIEAYIRELAERNQLSRVKPHVKLAAAALSAIETEANSKTVGAYEARDIAEVGMQRALHGHPIRPIGERLGELRKGRRLAPMLKAVPGGTVTHAVKPDPAGEERDGLGRMVAARWRCGDYLFDFRKAASGLPILTVTGAKLPMPYHMVVRGHGDAIQRSPDVARTFDQGEVPLEGVFRQLDDAAVRVKYSRAGASA